MTTDENITARNYDAQMAHTGRRQEPTKRRSGTTPEAKVTAECDKYLKSIGAIVIRTNAGSWADDQGNVIMGAKAGTSDKVLCLPPARGRPAPFTALELKSPTGRPTEAQKAFRSRVEALGGVYILAHSATELRQALIDHFGETAVFTWEAEGRARQAAKRAQRDALMKKNEQK